MKQPEKVFMESSLIKVIKLIEMWFKEQEAIINETNGTGIEDVSSMKQIPGF